MQAHNASTTQMLTVTKLVLGNGKQKRNAPASTSNTTHPLTRTSPPVASSKIPILKQPRDATYQIFLISVFSKWRLQTLLRSTQTTFSIKLKSRVWKCWRYHRFSSTEQWKELVRSDVFHRRCLRRRSLPIWRRKLRQIQLENNCEMLAAAIGLFHCDL